MRQPAVADEFLKHVDLFQALPAEQLAVCADAFVLARFAAGEMMFGRHDAGDRLYVVTKGRVRLSIVSEDGRELSVRIAGPRETLGEMSTLDGGGRSADAVALDAVEALALKRKDLDRLMVVVPSLAQNIIGFLCKRLRETTDQLEAIALHSVEQRLARLLLAEIGAGGSALRSLALSQAELGHLIGASRPKVNAALAALERAGAVGRSQSGAKADIGVLRRLAGLPDG